MRLSNGVRLVYYELKYLFRQLFLFILIIAAAGVILYFAWQEPSFVNGKIFDPFAVKLTEEQRGFFEGLTENYSVFEPGISEQELVSEIEVPGTGEKLQLREALYIGLKLSEMDKIKQQRRAVYEQVKEEKEYIDSGAEKDLNAQKTALLEKAYQQEPEYELYDFSGWEMYFILTAAMQPNNYYACMALFIMISAGLCLFFKDRDSHTRSYILPARYGQSGELYGAKLAAMFIYGIFVQVILSGVLITCLAFQGKEDMRHWLSSICNIGMYALCEADMSILSLYILLIVLLTLFSMAIVVFMLLFIRLVKQYILMLLGAAGLTGAVYFWLYRICGTDSDGAGWLLNPLSFLDIERFLKTDIMEVFGYAVPSRVVFTTLWGTVLSIMFTLFYHVWRQGLYEKR